jgi:hypothetical protein
MFIIPFTHLVKIQNNTKINIINILTISGQELWEEYSETNILNDIKTLYLEPNGLYTTNTPFIRFKGQDIYLCEIDKDRTNLQDFYKWDEIPFSDSETFCWRSFVHITDLSDNIWLPIPFSEKMSGFKIQDIIHSILSNKQTKE